MGRLQCGERQFPLDQAAHRALSAIDELGLTADLDCYGGDPTVWRCQLFDGAHALPWGEGHGKGNVAGARVGAMYEALEHYVVQRHVAAAVELRSCAEVAASAFSAQPYAAILAEQPDKLIACRTYNQLGGSNVLAVPLFLSNVWWVEEQARPLRAEIGDTTDYRSLARYSSNNGSAIGGSFAEAIIHAINEAIERDASSLFLLRTYVAATSSPPRFFDNATLPNDLLCVLDQVQARVGRAVWLVDITTDVNVPAALAYAPGPRGNFLRGYGASLSRHYSVYRALTELLEVALTEDKVESRCAAIELLEADPVLQACVAFELDAPIASLPSAAFTDTEAPGSPEAHLECLLETLSRLGFDVYANTVHVFANGITAVHVLIPELEQFNLLTDGPSAVVPGRRGIAVASIR